ncbi:hypothetical protein BC830DRAFT_591136 [Chytriomyces sp. MP71]|nr:hypothetical protein BC830DRAFT_591136 [Chytriomyces sp. MP71]
MHPISLSQNEAATAPLNSLAILLFLSRNSSRKTQSTKKHHRKKESMLQIVNAPSSPSPASPVPSEGSGTFRNRYSNPFAHFKQVQAQFLVSQPLCSSLELDVMSALDACELDQLKANAAQSLLEALGTANHVLAVEDSGRMVSLFWRNADGQTVQSRASLDLSALEDGEIYWVAGRAFRAIVVDQSQSVLVRL